MVTSSAHKWTPQHLDVARVRIIDNITGDAFLENVNRGATRKQESKTIFDALNDPDLPPDQRTAEHLVDEGHILLLAGTETTAKALTTGLCYLLLPENKNVLMTLQTELRQAYPDVSTWPTWNEVQKLPYLVSQTSPFCSEM